MPRKKSPVNGDRSRDPPTSSAVVRSSPLRTKNILVLIFRGWVDPRTHGTVWCPGKNPQWPGIDPGTLRLVAQCPKVVQSSPSRTKNILVLIFGGWVDPRTHGTVWCPGKKPQWLGIDSGTLRLVAQCLKVVRSSPLRTKNILALIFRGWVYPRTHGTVWCPGKNPQLPGIDPGTLRLVAQWYGRHPYAPRISWYLFLEAETTSGHMEMSDAPEKSRVIGDRSRDLPTSSAVP